MSWGFKTEPYNLPCSMTQPFTPLHPLPWGVPSAIHTFPTPSPGGCLQTTFIQTFTPPLLQTTPLAEVQGRKISLNRHCRHYRLTTRASHTLGRLSPTDKTGHCFPVPCSPLRHCFILSNSTQTSQAFYKSLQGPLLGARLCL